MRLPGGLVRNLFFPLALWRRGELRQQTYLAEFERTQYLSAEELRDLQLHRLRDLLRTAMRCPFHAQRLRQAGLAPDDVTSLEDLRALPVLEKREIQEHGPDMIARDWPADDLIRNQTGGSTGTPITFYLSRDRKCSRAAATVRHNRWAGLDIGDPAAVIWGAPRDRPAPTWRSRLAQLLLAEPFWLDTAGLSEETLGGFFRELCRQRPRVIQAYARSAVVFARWLEANNLSLPAPHSIITTAEMLEEEDRILIERAFGCPVYNRYGCREVSVIASECETHQGMHVMAEGLYLEIETPQGPARPGQMGSILVTDLLNHAMPLIRYRIGDLGAWAAGSCPCGRGLPRLEKLAGRVTEFLVASDGRLVSGVFLATYVVAQRPTLGQVQIDQSRKGEVLYRVCPGPGFDPETDLGYLRQATREHLGATEVRLEIVQEFPRSPSGKFLFSRSTVTPGWLGGQGKTTSQGRASAEREAVLDMKCSSN